jgi:OOP family OmpA-OmpF porin
VSQAWSNAVAGHFVSKGIQMDRLRALGLGESQPLEDNRSKAGRKKNKRVEVVFLFRRN